MEWLKDKYVEIIVGTTTYEGLVEVCELYYKAEEPEIPLDWETNDEAAAKYQRRYAVKFDPDEMLRYEIKLRRIRKSGNRLEVEIKFLQMKPKEISRIKIKPEVERMFFKLEHDL